MIEHFDWLDLLFNERLESPGGPMHVSMDTSATYARAARIALPHAMVVVDRFHLVQLANQALTEHRRELTWATRGRRGREVDPEWAQRNRLLRAGETLTAGEAAKMHDAMRTADLAGKGTAPQPAHPGPRQRRRGDPAAACFADPERGNCVGRRLKAANRREPGVMGLHESDRVVATRDIDNTVTGLGVRAGTPGVVLRQVGTTPATFRVRFAPAEEPAGRSIVVDDLTDHDIAPGYEDGGV